tara:strand:- start:50 stop:364 length:315 start_codon:yes stop_codon:yes gene_type:complete
MATKKVARGDAQDVVTTGHCCQGTTSTDECSDDVFAVGYGIVRIGDKDTTHLLCTDPCGPTHQVALSTSSPSVYVNGAKIGCETDGYGGEIISSVTQSKVYAIT